MNPTDSVRWGIVADDLTGACDAGVHFAQSGFRTVVWLETVDAGSEPADVIVLTTNSRCDPPEIATEKTRGACRSLHAVGARIVYKKIDSTLLGNPGPETETVRQEGGFELALLTPAFPEMGRAVVNGVLHVRNSGLSVDLVERLREQGLKAVVPRTPDQLGYLQACAGSTVVIDAASRADLASIAQAAFAMQPLPLLAGSAGLAAEVAARLAGCPPHPGPTWVPVTKKGPKPVVVMVGSTNPVTLRQVEYLEARRHGRYTVVRASIEPTSSQTNDLSAILRDARAGGIVLTGGDTALLVCRILEAKGIRLGREILPGIPWGRIIGGSADGTAVATKAGGFGEPEALACVADFLAVNA